MVLRPGLRVVILALILASLGGTNGAELDLTWMRLVGWETAGELQLPLSRVQILVVL